MGADDVLEWWEERAAILEFECGMPRGEAEAEAWGLAWRWLWK